AGVALEDLQLGAGGGFEVALEVVGQAGRAGAVEGHGAAGLVGERQRVGRRGRRGRGRGGRRGSGGRARGGGQRRGGGGGRGRRPAAGWARRPGRPAGWPVWRLGRWVARPAPADRRSAAGPAAAPGGRRRSAGVGASARWLLPRGG